MGLIVKPRDQAEEYTVQAGDTLTSIASTKGLDSWKTLARFNFGTTRASEVVRALVETVGVKQADQAGEHKDKPATLPLTPDAKLGTPKILVPKPWKQDLEGKKAYTVFVQKTRPAAAVGFRALDRWFIPKTEKCEVKYALDGNADVADKLAMLVFGSNYCECTGWSDGLGAWGAPADLADEPIFKKDLSAPTRGAETALADGGWEGDASTDKGMLSRKTGTATKRYVNVAFSPYTVVLRAWKDGEAEDAKALLLVKPFWPEFEETKTEVTPTVTGTGPLQIAWTNAAVAERAALEVKDKAGRRVFFAVLEGDHLKAGARSFTWDGRYLGEIQNTHGDGRYLDDSASLDGDGSPNNENAPYTYKVTTSVSKVKKDSLKIEWEVRKTTRLAQGIVRVVDKNNKLVFERPLTKALVGQGEHKVDDWEGAYADGVKNSADEAKVIAADMPYRVEVRAHTGPHEEKGLALAAMHTEVRLHVAKGTAEPEHFAYEPRIAPQSFTLEPAPEVRGVAPTEGTALVQMKLAEFGYHPGPVTGSTNEHYERALREFKRSVPRQKTTTNYQRMAIDTSETNDLFDAIRHIRATDKRKRFGDRSLILTNHDAPDLSDEGYKNALKDSKAHVVVWVDDRQYYTAADAANDEQGNTFLSGAAPRERLGLMDYRGRFNNGDTKVTLDVAEIPRPWVPLQAAPRLMSRTKHLTDDPPSNPSTDELAAMRAALGPLRVDWSIDELCYDLSTVNTGHANYDKDYVRTQRYVQWALQQNQATHTRADTRRPAVYTNCTVALGGSRPSSAATYHAEVYGEGDLSLAPWKAKGVSAKECTATVAHDHIADGQRNNKELFEEALGYAGVYFRPSIVAGDGYRVKAELRFEKFDGYEFPNLDALKKRYPVRPQSHGPEMRVWRRSSFRGHCNWSDQGGHWGSNFIDAFREFYRAAHVYFVHEGGAAYSLPITSVFDAGTPSHVTRFKKLVTKNVTKAALQDEGKITISASYLWPWADRDNFGWPDLSTVNLAQNSINTWIDSIYTATWRKFRAALLLALVREAENKGQMRGHLMVEFKSSPAYQVIKYRCNGTTQHIYWGIAKTGTVYPHHNIRCPTPGCNTAVPARSRLAAISSIAKTSMGLPAVGGALGATWLFIDGEEARNKTVWVHEVGHHRHLEHAANGPGSDSGTAFHDEAQNEKIGDWSTIKGNADPLAKRWDRRCIMSYSDCKYGENGYFCGVCVMRNRGWRVASLGGPGTKHAHP